MSRGKFWGVVVSLAVMLVPAPLSAGDWETSVDGQRAYDQVQELIKYKRGQAGEVEAIFRGLRDKLYVIRPQSRTSYDNNFLTPSTVTYTVQVTASFDANEVAALQRALSSAKFLRKGDRQVQFSFPAGKTHTISLYDEIYPTYETLVRGGYAFEARAVLLDADQTVLAVADTSLLLSTPTHGEGGLDLSGSPRLQSYTRLEPPDLSQWLSGDRDDDKELHEFLERYFALDVYRLSDAGEAVFYSLPLTVLKRAVRCRVLRDSDELLLYEKDAD